MPEELCTVDEAAERLKLHPKTVLRFINEGRLRATRLGKSFRIRRADLDELLGIPQRTEDAASPWVTAIVDVPGTDAERARKWARQIPSALKMRPAEGPTLRADVVYEPERAHLKIVIVGPPADTAQLLSLVQIWLEE